MVTLNLDEFKIGDLVLRRLGIEDAEILQELCSRCAGNDNIIAGSSREANQGETILRGLPTGKTYDDKFVIGVFEEGKMIGVLDMVRDFPVKGELILGLMMFDPEVTGRGLRGKLHECVVNWAQREGFDKLRLDVIGDNKDSYEFWHRIGYTETQRVSLKLQDKYVEAIIMNYQLRQLH